jgi:ADP-L-glycero-D-manno-heptose 6-epimerase
MLWLLDNPGISGLYNMGTGQARSFIDLAAAVYGALGCKLLVTFRDTPTDIRGQYQYFTQAHMGRLRAAGYTKPFTTLEKGVTETVRKYLSQPDPYR